MTALFIDLLLMFLVITLMSAAAGVLTFYFRRRKVYRYVREQDSGLYVEHGAVIDPKTGEAKPEKKPSKHAFAELT
jgi:hypothetical protein